MATGRSLTDFERVYIGGYDMSGYAVNPGERGIEYNESEGYAMSDAVKGVLAGMPKVTLGPILGLMDNTATSGLHAVANAAQGTKVYCTVVRGVRAAPVDGDDCFSTPMYLTKYKAVSSDSGLSSVRIDLAGVDPVDALNYDEVFGHCLHVMGAETDANAGSADVDNAAATAFGGWLMYHITSITGAGTVTISVDDSANNADWLALASATTGEIATASAPTSGIVQLGTTATVRRYLRWQIAFGGSATACTFALTFMRGRNQG